MLRFYDCGIFILFIFFLFCSRRISLISRNYTFQITFSHVVWLLMDMADLFVAITMQLNSQYGGKLSWKLTISENHLFTMEDLRKGDICNYRASFPANRPTLNMHPRKHEVRDPHNAFNNNEQYF